MRVNICGNSCKELTHTQCPSAITAVLVYIPSPQGCRHSKSPPPFGGNNSTFPVLTKEVLVKLSVDSNVLHRAKI